MNPKQLFEALDSESNPVKVFGTDAEEAKKFYHALARICHPDTGGSELVMQRLNYLWNSWNPDAPVLLGKGDVADVYALNQFQCKKVCRASYDADLMRNEAESLDVLQMQKDFNIFHFFPIVSLFENLGTDCYTILEYPNEVNPSDLISLESLKNSNPDIRHLGWIWRRLVYALSFAHGAGIVHGAVLPSHILIGAAAHDVFLIDWTNSSDIGAPAHYIPTSWEEFYPETLRNSKPGDKVPVVPELDIYMAAKTMQWTFPAMPQLLFQYFTLLQSESLGSVISDTRTLIDTFDTRIYKFLGWRKEFVTLAMLNWSALRKEMK